MRGKPTENAKPEHYVPHMRSSSSEPSKQSFCPSHCHVLVMHMEFAQRNSCIVHARPANTTTGVLSFTALRDSRALFFLPQIIKPVGLHDPQCVLFPFFFLFFFSLSSLSVSCFFFFKVHSSDSVVYRQMTRETKLHAFRFD